MDFGTFGLMLDAAVDKFCESMNKEEEVTDSEFKRIILETFLDLEDRPEEPVEKNNKGVLTMINKTASWQMKQLSNLVNFEREQLDGVKDYLIYYEEHMDEIAKDDIQMLYTVLFNTIHNLTLCDSMIERWRKELELREKTDEMSRLHVSDE